MFPLGLGNRPKQLFKHVKFDGGSVRKSTPVVETTQTWALNLGTDMQVMTAKRNDVYGPTPPSFQAAMANLEEWRYNGVQMFGFGGGNESGTARFKFTPGTFIESANGYGFYFVHPSGGSTYSMGNGGFVLPTNRQVQWNNTTGVGWSSDGVVNITDSGANLRDLTLRNLLGTGNLATGLAIKTASYTSTANDCTALFNASAGACVYTLETAVGCNGRIKVIVKTDSSANTVTIDPNATETVNGASTLVLSAQWDRAVLQSDGANWIRIA